MEVKSYYVYILASKKNGTLSIGVTNNLLRRVHEHKCGTVPGFTRRYGVDKLVYYETFAKVYDLLTAGKRLKAWKRQWKIELIEEHNPQWHDLYDVLTGPVDSCFRRNDRVSAIGSLQIPSRDRVDGVHSSCISRVRNRPSCHSCARSPLDSIEGRNPGTGRPQKAFTLIELLVVISVIALLMSILMPMLQRARKHAKAVACQGNLRQWSILYAAYAAENDGHLPGWDGLFSHPGEPPSSPGDSWWGWWGWWGPWVGGPEQPKSQWYTTTKGIMCCPMATKPANTTDRGDPAGGTFLAWGWGRWGYGHGSYGMNGWANWWYRGAEPDERRFAWLTTDVKNSAGIPMLLDSCWPWGGKWHELLPPPEFDAVPTRPSLPSSPPHPFCINRHDGYVNGMFLDWSVRKVGIKELWTLTWDKEYDAAGPWTMRGGVKPEDWPRWMRRFRDY